MNTSPCAELVFLSSNAKLETVFSYGTSDYTFISICLLALKARKTAHLALYLFNLRCPLNFSNAAAHIEIVALSTARGSSFPIRERN